MRSDPAGLLGEIADRADELRLLGIAPDVEDEDQARIETTGPEMAAVVGEARVVGLVAAADGERMDDLA
jgi:hypothetical protein